MGNGVNMLINAGFKNKEDLMIAIIRGNFDYYLEGKLISYNKDSDYVSPFYIGSGLMENGTWNRFSEVERYKVWQETLNGESENNVLCWVWDNDEIKNPRNAVRFVVDYVNGDNLPYKTVLDLQYDDPDFDDNEEYRFAEPVSPNDCFKSQGK